MIVTSDNKAFGEQRITGFGMGDDDSISINGVNCQVRLTREEAVRVAVKLNELLWDDR